MGGRGSNSRIKQRVVTSTVQATQPQAPQQGPISDQVPDDNNTPVNPDPISDLQQMDDAQLAQLFLDSQKAKLPNHLNDADDQTQKFVFTIGMNDKPTLLDQAEFNQYLADNNIDTDNILARSINGGSLKTTAGNQSNLTPQQIVNMIKNSRLTYIGGKQGGQAYGAGTYMAQTGGVQTGYGGTTFMGVLNPSTARVVSESQLDRLAAAFDRSHPKFARATGGYNKNFYNNNMSIYALAMGYNVITDGTNRSGAYYNIIDRKALVLLK